MGLMRLAGMMLLANGVRMKFPALAGVKVIVIEPFEPAGRLKVFVSGLNGSVVVTLPVRTRSPPLVSWKLRLLPWPTITGPKFRLAGPSDNCGGRFVTTM